MNETEHDTLSLTDVFGHCVIPKNTLLFRGHKDKSFDDCMFFGLKHFVAGAFGGDIQVWKVITDIKVLFLVEEVDDRSWTLSALPRLYTTIFPEEGGAGFDDLDIKHWDINRRNKLVRKLYNEFGISGWFTSLEDKIELEVCLFDKQANSNQLLLVDIANRNNKTYFKDSLNRMKIFAPQTFYERTKLILDEKAISHLGNQNHYKRYIKYQNAWIREGKTKQERIVLRHYYSDLRTKLKI